MMVSDQPFRKAFLYRMFVSAADTMLMLLDFLVSIFEAVRPGARAMLVLLMVWTLKTVRP